MLDTRVSTVIIDPICFCLPTSPLFVYIFRYVSCFISLWPSDVVWRHRTLPTLSMVMACRLFGDKPLAESMLRYKLPWRLNWSTHTYTWMNTYIIPYKGYKPSHCRSCNCPSSYSIMYHISHFTCDNETLHKMFHRRSKRHIHVLLDYIQRSTLSHTRWLDPVWIGSKSLRDKFEPVELDPVLDMIQKLCDRSKPVRLTSYCPGRVKILWLWDRFPKSCDLMVIEICSASARAVR